MYDVCDKVQVVSRRHNDSLLTRDTVVSRHESLEMVPYSIIGAISVRHCACASRYHSVLEESVTVGAAQSIWNATHSKRVV